eukprot:1155923-Pelagomonas_calceolata.AAC.3
MQASCQFACNRVQKASEVPACLPLVCTFDWGMNNRQTGMTVYDCHAGKHGCNTDRQARLLYKQQTGAMSMGSGRQAGTVSVQAGRQAGTVSMQAGRQTDRQAQFPCRQADRQTDRQAQFPCRQADRQTGRHSRQTDRQAGTVRMQAGRQAGAPFAQTSMIASILPFL